MYNGGMKKSDATSLLRRLVALPSVEPTQTDRPGEIGAKKNYECYKISVYIPYMNY